MDAEGLKDLFAPFGPVAVKRMFGGHGVYADGLCFAIQSGGEVYLKTDDDTKAEFVTAGSQPFIYDAKGRAIEMSFWRLAAGAYDDEDELRRWAGFGLAAARRAAAGKAKAKAGAPKRRSATKARR